MTATHLQATAPAVGVGRIIRQRREELHLSQWDLAVRTHLHRSFISRIESGERFPDRYTMDCICDALAMTEVERMIALSAAGLIERPLTPELCLVILRHWELIDGLEAARLVTETYAVAD